MNKAFIREPDATDVLCPKCGAAGTSVPRQTVESLAPSEALRPLAVTAYFCATPRCPVAYFDAFEAMVAADQLVRPVYPKDPAAPLCPCFGLTREDVEADAADTSPRRIRELLAKSKTSQAHCESVSPTGRNCLPEVQRMYFRLRQGVSGED
jgi:CopZ-like zinc binding protein